MHEGEGKYTLERHAEEIASDIAHYGHQIYSNGFRVVLGIAETHLFNGNTDMAAEWVAEAAYWLENGEIGSRTIRETAQARISYLQEKISSS
ncbi:hypothetical protein HYU11_03975 [Candidatus Woesearchaeota archaeon]|nr:hypothetical protein [Candidatus Woesearchaeota archaeon]